jgi:hypothetical protein
MKSENKQESINYKRKKYLIIPGTKKGAAPLQLLFIKILNTV